MTSDLYLPVQTDVSLMPFILTSPLFPSSQSVNPSAVYPSWDPFIIIIFLFPNLENVYRNIFGNVIFSG